MRIAELFQEDNGNLSSTRLLAFECVNVGLFIGVYATIAGNVDLEVIGLASSFVTLGLTGKVMQKRFEQKNGEPHAAK